MRVLFVSTALALAALSLQGDFFQMWQMRQDYHRLQSDLVATNKKTKVLEGQVRGARDPVYMERQAKDRLDMVGEDDLEFVFSDDD